MAEFGEPRPFYRILVMSALALAIGLVVALAAIAFVDAVLWLNQALLIAPRARARFETAPMLVAGATLAVPTLGGLLVGFLISRFSPERRPLGPPDVIRAAQLDAPLPSGRAGLVSTFAAVLSLGFGASVGQYGPMVYMGAMIGGLARKLRTNIPNLRAIAIACGVAAAIATAFNAPIAGMVFAHEVILRHYAMQAFAPTTVAAASGYVVANVFFERPVLFLVAFDGVEHGHEFLLFALLGALAAGIAVIFMRAVLFLGARAKRFPGDPALKPALAGLAVGACALFLPDVLGVGREALRFATLEGAYAAPELVVLWSRPRSA